jgi:hypothetical protein
VKPALQRGGSSEDVEMSPKHNYDGEEIPPQIRCPICKGRPKLARLRKM